MITYKGRVVYERETHLFTEKDAARIMKSLTADQSPTELAKTLWGIDVEIIELKVLSDDDIYAFVTMTLALIIKWVGLGTAWLWDFLTGILLPPPSIEPEAEPEERDG